MQWRPELEVPFTCYTARRCGNRISQSAARRVRIPLPRLLPSDRFCPDWFVPSGTSGPIPGALMHFTDLGLSADILRAVTEQGYDTPTPIQAQAIPVVLGRPRPDGRRPDRHRQDRRLHPAHPATARPPATGPSNAASRAAWSSCRRANSPSRCRRACAPTASICTSRLPPSSAASAWATQLAALSGGVDIIVATPGRLLDHIEQRSADLSAIEILVLDEADRMLDMGFIRDIRKIIAPAAEAEADPAVLRHLLRRDSRPGHRPARQPRQRRSGPPQCARRSGRPSGVSRRSGAQERPADPA